MKILQIERVIPDLLNRGSVKRVRANFEFHDEHNGADDDHRVDPAPHSWNAEFKEDATLKSVQGIKEQSNLDQPRIPLSLQNRKASIRGECSDDFIGILGQKF